MKRFERIYNYINDTDFKINIFFNKVNVINYDLIRDISDSQIVIIAKDKKIFIKGEKMKLIKLLNDEILITGIIKRVEL